MTIGRLDNSINPIHLVTPDRVIVPMSKPFDSPVGVVPFHRVLLAENLAHTSEIQPAKQAPIARTPDTFEPSSSLGSTGLMPKLGEVLPVEPTKMAPAKIQQAHQVQVPATGRLLDLYL